MPHFQDDEKKTIKNDFGYFGFYFCKIITGYPCVSPYILYYMHGPAILL